MARDMLRIAVTLIAVLVVIAIESIMREALVIGH